MDKQQIKKILKLAIFIYFASFLILNWNDISWVFNYRHVSGLLSDFFNPYSVTDASSFDDDYFYPNHSKNTASKSEVKTKYTEKQNVLEIPKLSLEAPIVFSASPDNNSIMKDLDLGVVYYPGSVYPGEEGQIVILGHSAPLGWPKIKHDWVFSEIDKLNSGDHILINLNGKQYRYVVTEKNIVERGENITDVNLADSNNVLTLISCWPPGKDYQRITVSAELQDNI